MTALKPSSYKNGKSIGCGIFGFCLLSFPQNESKIYKLRQLSLSQFVCFLMEVCFLFNFWMIEFTIMSKKSIWHFHHSEKRQKPNIPHLRDVWVFAQFCYFQALQIFFFICPTPACEKWPFLKDLTCRQRNSTLYKNSSYLDPKKDNLYSKSRGQNLKSYLFNIFLFEKWNHLPN